MAALSDSGPVPRGDRHEHHHDDDEVVHQPEEPEDELGQDVKRREEVDEDDLRFVHAMRLCSHFISYLKLFVCTLFKKKVSLN